MSDLNIIIPLYKSGNSIPALVQRLDEWIEKTDLDVKVIFVDDGSQDGTYEKLLGELSAVSFDFMPLQLATNYGQHTATAIGFSHADAPLIATIDDDLQHDPFELDQMLQQMQAENSDLIYGVYDQKKHSFVRNLGSSILKRILLSGGNDYSSVTSFRLMKASAVSAFRNRRLSVMFVDEYLMRYASRQSTCLVKHHERKSGSSSYSGMKLLKLALGILLFHSSVPLKLITRFGLLMSLVFFVFGCIYIYQKWMYNVQLGFTSLIVAIFFSTGMILLSLGIIGEYVRKIWVSQHQLDQVIVLER